MNGNQMNGIDGPMTPELHLKMSKKIAQLTKVVYALNTKNDEHEAHVLCLQEAHELELKKVLCSAEDQVKRLHAIVANQRNDKEIISEMKSRILEYETNGESAIQQFKTFKKETHEREKGLKRSYEDQMRTMKTELDSIKGDYTSLCTELGERSHERDASSSMLKAMKEKHEKELELLKEVSEQEQIRHDQTLADLMKEQEETMAALKEGHRKELGSLINSEKSSLTAMYKTQISQLEEEVGTLRQVMDQADEQSNTRIGLLAGELEDLERRFGETAGERERLLVQNLLMENELSGLREKTVELQRDLDLAIEQLGRAENDLTEQKNAAKQQAIDNLQNAGKIGELDELTQLHTIENERLQFEIRKLKDKVGEREDELKSLKEKNSKSIRQWEDKNNQLKKDVTVKEEEMTRLQTEHALSLEELAVAAQEKESAREAAREAAQLEAIRLVREQGEKELNEVLEVSRANSQAIREALEAEAASEKQALTDNYESQLYALGDKSASLEAQVVTLAAEVERLRNVMSSSESSLSETTQEREKLMQELTDRQGDIELLHSELNDKISVLQNLREEFDKEVEGHIATKKQREQYADDKVAIAVQEKEDYWSKKHKVELDALEHELLRRQSQSRNTEIKRLKDTHVQEFLETEAMWQDKVTALQTKIKALEKQLNLMNIEALKKEMSLNEKSQSDYEELQAKIQQLKADHAVNIKEIEAEHKEAMIRLEESIKRDAKNLEDKLILAHRQNMHDLTKTNKLSVDALKDQLEQKRIMDIATAKHAARRELEQQLVKCRKECGEKSELRLHELTLSYEEQKEELQRELEMRDREMKQTETKIGQLNSELTDRQLELAQFREELAVLQQELEDMEAVCGTKSKEVLQIKQEAVIQIKKREKKLNSLHVSELKNAGSLHARDIDSLNFKHQNDIEALRLELGELNSSLRSADERFDNRPSRPEDLQKIIDLEDTILEAGGRIKCLVEEKKYFQLELMNRESNYNKVFNTAPKIGVINPMNVKTKITKKTRSDTTMRSPHKSPLANGGTTPAYSSPNLPHNSRKPQLVPISSRTSSLDSLVALGSGSDGPAPRRGNPVVAPPRRVVKNAFSSNSNETVVAPT